MRRLSDNWRPIFQGTARYHSSFQVPAKHHSICLLPASSLIIRAFPLCSLSPLPPAHLHRKWRFRFPDRRHQLFVFTLLNYRMLSGKLHNADTVYVLVLPRTKFIVLPFAIMQNPLRHQQTIQVVCFTSSKLQESSPIRTSSTGVKQRRLASAKRLCITAAIHPMTSCAIDSNYTSIIFCWFAVPVKWKVVRRSD